MHGPHRSVRGVAALPVIFLLLFALALAALAAQHREHDALRAATRQQEASQAFASAEAGLDWALAMLDEPRPVDAGCAATASAVAPFRDRHLAVAPGTGRISVADRRASCVRVGDAWRCRCPDGDEAPAPVDDPAAGAAFEVRFAAADTPGLVRVVSTGCRRLPCPDAAGAADPAHRLEATLGLVPALAQPPLAALTVRDDVDAGDAPIGLHNGDAASGGIAVQAGGRVLAPRARWGGAAGAPAPILVENDARLRATEPPRLFATLFGLDLALWRRQPGVAAVACSMPCDGPLAEALATHRLAFVDGDLALAGTRPLGTPERPVIVVARGAVRLRGAVTVHGLVYGASLAWQDAGAGALVRGALVSEAGYAGNGAPDIVHDPGVLAALRAAGGFARLPGGWKDFR